MYKELLYQEKPLSFFVSPEIIEVDNEFENEQKFIEICLKDHPTEAVEDVSSEIHETNRIPDPRILIIEGENILRLDGILVDDSIEKTSYLGKLEYEAFEKIKNWAGRNKDGVEIWFSPPFGSIYPVSKIDLGEIRYPNSTEQKVLLKKAVLLDIDTDKLLSIANDFALSIGYQSFLTSEQLRANPIFCTRSEMKHLLSNISSLTNQTQMIMSGEDLHKKIEVYQKLEPMQREIYNSSFHHHQNISYYLRERAEREKMMGKEAGSCPTKSLTAFQSFSGEIGGAMEDEYGSLEFECPHCGRTNLRPFGQLLSHCQHCGGDVRC